MRFGSINPHFVEVTIWDGYAFVMAAFFQISATFGHEFPAPGNT